MLQYLITFTEGVISFISPCMLPMLPVYISYFTGSKETAEKDGETGKIRRTVLISVFFVLGFTAVFTLLGVFAGVAGSFLSLHRTAVNIICGAAVIFFGLSYLDIIRLPFLKCMKEAKPVTGCFSAFLFGAVYALNLTPCVGAFLGSALMLASSEASSVKGAALLVCYSLGLGLPFILSAVLLERLGTLFGFIKRHLKAVKIISALFLIITGVLIMTGLMGRLPSIFSR